MDVWLVAHAGLHYNIRGIYASHDKALAAWNEVRLEIQKQYQELLDGAHPLEMYRVMVENLSDENPETCLNGGYHDHPSLIKHEVIL